MPLEVHQAPLEVVHEGPQTLAPLPVLPVTTPVPSRPVSFESHDVVDVVVEKEAGDEAAVDEVDEDVNSTVTLLPTECEYQNTRRCRKLSS